MKPSNVIASVSVKPDGSATVQCNNTVGFTDIKFADRKGAEEWLWSEGWYEDSGLWYPPYRPSSHDRYVPVSGAPMVTQPYLEKGVALLSDCCGRLTVRTGMYTTGLFVFDYALSCKCVDGMRQVLPLLLPAPLMFCSVGYWASRTDAGVAGVHYLHIMEKRHGETLWTNVHKDILGARQ